MSQNDYYLKKINLQKYIPANAIDFCYALWEKYPFSLIFTIHRLSKLGDYRFLKKENRHIITINGDLNPYAFTITYIHEVAHRVSYEHFNNKVKPHGKEWKKIFKLLMNPLLSENIFPANILNPLIDYMKNPAATTHSHIPLFLALKKYDQSAKDTHILGELPNGQTFRFQHRTFRKLHLRRTRVVCQDISSKRHYLISVAAEVCLVA